MSRSNLTRRAGTLALAAATGALTAAAPAAADVTVSPASAAQGDGANLTFRVTNTARSPITRVRLVLPPDAPMAEVYPLSADDWAPLITTRTLGTPLTTIHGGTPVTETAEAITWVAVPGKELAPGSSADLSVAVGPLPALRRMQFELRPTYADGSAGPAETPAELALTPPVAAVAGAHDSGHAAAPEPAQAEDGRNWLGLAGWVVAALAAAGATLVTRRSRRRSEPAATGKAEPEVIDREPVGAGTWRYRE